MRVLALCAGYGGLELGLHLAGYDVGLVAYAEIDTHASKVMARHWPDAPNLGDLTAMTDPPHVDIVTAGFPCQPVSTAGRREGTADERWLIRDVVSVWRRSGAHRLVLENVPGLLTANDGEAFGQVLEALAEVGATVEWACVRASDVGACHRRERWFAVADANVEGLERPEPERRHDLPPRGASPDAENVGLERAGQPRRRGDGPQNRSGTAPDADGRGRSIVGSGELLDGQRPPFEDDVNGCDRSRFGGYAAAVHRWEHTIGRHAPDPTVSGRLNPQFVEWMMGLPAGWVTDLDLSRAQQLRILGNGVVPQQAAAALRILDRQQVAA